MTTLAALALVPGILAIGLFANGVARSIVGLIGEVFSTPRRREMHQQQPSDQHSPFDRAIAQSGSVVSLHDGGE